MSFSAFITPYYEERLNFYERLDLARCSEAELLDSAGEASALHKFLIDILEEGYTDHGEPTCRTDRCHQPAPTVFVHGASAPGESLGTGTFLSLPRPAPTAPAHYRDVRRRSDLRVTGVSRPSRSAGRAGSGHCPLLRACGSEAALASQNSGADDGNGCLSPLDLSAACAAHPRCPRAIAPGYPLNPFGTHLAASPRHADTRTKAADDWAEICRPL